MVISNANAGLITLNNSTTINTLSLSESFISFYSYGSPNGSSANTGFEQESTAVMFLAEYNGELALFTLLDAKGGANATRSANMTLSDFDLSNVILVDDSSESNTNGFNWKWVRCCTDGMVYNIENKNNFDIDINFSSVNGLADFKFLSFSSGYNQPKEHNVGTSFSIQSALIPLPSIASIPEPSAFLIFIAGLIGLTFSKLKILQLS